MKVLGDALVLALWAVVVGGFIVHVRETRRGP